MAISALMCAAICTSVMTKTSKWSMTLYYGVHYKADKGDDINVTGIVTFVSKDSSKCYLYFY